MAALANCAWSGPGRTDQDAESVLLNRRVYPQAHRRKQNVITEEQAEAPVTAAARSVKKKSRPLWPALRFFLVVRSRYSERALSMSFFSSGKRVAWSAFFKYSFALT